MKVLSQLRMDRALESDGAWTTVWADPDGKKQPVRVRVARLSRPEVQEAIAAALRQRPEGASTDDLTHADRMRLMAPAIAETVVRDWSGVVDEETGEEVPYSPAACLELLRDPELYELYEHVIAFANSRTNYRRTSEAANAKN